MTRRDDDPPCKHPPPRKHVLLLTCMDTRLLDNTVTFMNQYNLQNRYDQLVFAGAALGVMHLSSPPLDGSKAPHATWKEVFFHHLQVALDILDRQVKDIFILEHRDCGAYQHFHPTHHEPYGDDEAGQKLEEEHHAEQAFALADAVRAFCQQQLDKAKDELEHATDVQAKAEALNKLDGWKDIHVRCFLMDLNGEVKHLCETHAKNKRTVKKSKHLS